MSIEQNFTRRHVDLEFVINERKLLTKKEFELTLPNSNYDNYVKEFYRRKITKFYERNCNTQWFVEKFFSDSFFKDKILERYHNFSQKMESDFSVLDSKNEFTRRFNEVDKKYIFLERIPPNYSEDDVCELLRPFKEIKKLELSKSNYNTVFDREAVITIFPDSDLLLCKEKVEELCTKGIHVQPFELGDDIIIKSAWVDCRDKDSANLRKIFTILNKNYKTNIAYECDNGDKFITFLRHVFLYCYYCARHFETEIEMIRKCGDYHVRDGRVQRRVFDRKQKIITMERDFGYLKTDSPETELEKYIIKMTDSVFRCDLCHKTFEQLVYVKKHIRNKHEKLYSDIEQGIVRFNNFLDRIDINLLNYFDGIDNNYLPTFCVHEEEGNAVKYDLKRLFSGDIKISK